MSSCFLVHVNRGRRPAPSRQGGQFSYQWFRLPRLQSKLCAQASECGWFSMLYGASTGRQETMDGQVGSGRFSSSLIADRFGQARDKRLIGRLRSRWRKLSSHSCRYYHGSLVPFSQLGHQGVNATVRRTVQSMHDMRYIPTIRSHPAWTGEGMSLRRTATDLTLRTRAGARASGDAFLEL